MGGYVISDGSTFSIELGGARICFIAPESLRAAKDCVAVDLSVYKEPPAKPGLVRLANGILRKPDDPGDPQFLGTVIVSKLAVRTDDAPDQAAADRFALGLTDTEGAPLPEGVKYLAPKARIVKNGDTVLVRATVDVDGLPTDDSSAHREVLVAFGRESAYSTVWTSRATDASIVKGYADSACASATLAADARPRRPIDMKIVGGVVALFLVVALVVRSRKKKPASEPPPPAASADSDD